MTAEERARIRRELAARARAQMRADAAAFGEMCRSCGRRHEDGYSPNCEACTSRRRRNEGKMTEETPEQRRARYLRNRCLTGPVPPDPATTAKRSRLASEAPRDAQGRFLRWGAS